MLQQLRRAHDKSCKRDLAVWMDCKHAIYTVLFRVNFRMSGHTEKLQMKLMIRVRTQEWVLPEGTDTNRRRR